MNGRLTQGRPANFDIYSELAYVPGVSEEVSRSSLHVCTQEHIEGYDE